MLSPRIHAPPSRAALVTTSRKSCVPAMGGRFSTTTAIARIPSAASANSLRAYAATEYNATRIPKIAV